jgi:hypothetical protein
VLSKIKPPFGVPTKTITFLLMSISSRPKPNKCSKIILS